MASFNLVGKTASLALMALGIASNAFPHEVQSVTGEATPSDLTSQSNAGLDFSQAQPMPLPHANVRPPSEAESRGLVPGVHPASTGSAEGSAGSGEQSPVRVAPERDLRTGQ
ncbi:hypothetical protein CBA19CS22_17745 [Caballeronia novacaledonica]|uniref:Uncharacterized protein n=1 Tax=Caballeronia novacaledonica TaxID=1544861 RepID=A0ACB5QUA3_9BURK|nr:hypothetical protein CBA19CS22_17745 [Caballeronia novacaledonica]